MLWLRDEQPTTYERAAGLLLPGSALLAWLTGERLVDHANASSTLLYDITTRAWAPDMLEATGLDAGRLGTIADAADVAGTLRPGAAEALGLTTTTRVVVGTGDEHSAALGAGGIQPGIVIDITGTAEPVAVAATSPVIDDTGLVETHGHADPRVWLVENPGFVSGGSVAWFTEAFGGGATAAQLDAEAAAATVPGTNGVTFLPTLSGATAPRWNDRARGVYAGLSLNHGRAHLYRALLEGCTFALRDIVDRLDAMGLVGDEIRVVGGGARSPLWLQMKADVTGRAVRVMASDESTALGAAMLAGVGAGTFAGLDEAVEQLAVVEPKVYEPDRATAGAYDDAYGRYRALFDALEPGFGTSPEIAATEPGDPS
jgi:xylulokinase